MKSTILKITFLASITIAGLTSCSNSTSQKAEDVEEAKTNLADAKEDLTQARLDSAKEYGQYRESAELRLQKNDEEIAELKAKMKADKKVNSGILEFSLLKDIGQPIINCAVKEA